MPKLKARVLVRLPGFVDPDTGSQREGWVEPGEYAVDDYKTDFPTAQTDFALLQVPGLGANDTWVCSRWNESRYASVEAAAIPAPPEVDFAGDPFAIAESHLVDLLPHFHDFTYDLDDARYPFEVDGVHLPLAPPRSNNCCTFVEGLLAKAWAQTDGFEWNARRHGQMMIFSADDFFSPVTAAVESGMAVLAPDPDAAPHPWSVVQGWRHQWRGGHTFLILAHHKRTDRVLTLESNSAYALDGVGCRGLGNLRDLPHGRPPADWWKNENAWTWERICSTYRLRQVAYLKVLNPRWVGRAGRGRRSSGGRRARTNRG
jgi:hypothetical protein